MIWVICAERIKKGRVRTIPFNRTNYNYWKPLISSQAIVNIFPVGKSNKNHISKETVNKELVRMGMKGRQIFHGLRVLAATTLNEINCD